MARWCSVGAGGAIVVCLAVGCARAAGSGAAGAGGIGEAGAAGAGGIGEAGAADTGGIGEAGAGGTGEAGVAGRGASRAGQGGVDIVEEGSVGDETTVEIHFLDSGAAATDSDPDGDGVNTEADNCPLLPNADQLDEDDDGVGDACAVVDADVAGQGKCALSADGTLWCWGTHPLLGDEAGKSPTRIGDYGQWRDVAAGCLIDSNQRLWCRNPSEDTTAISNSCRLRQLLPGQDWVKVDGNGSSYCGVRASGQAMCWGANEWAQLGVGDQYDRQFPTTVTGPGTWTKVSIGLYHACGISEDGQLWCWGGNFSGQLGRGPEVHGSCRSRESMDCSSVPLRVGASNWVDVDVARTTTCALDASGAFYCWGGNVWWPAQEPVEVCYLPSADTEVEHCYREPMLRATEVESFGVGPAHACVVDRDQRLVCGGQHPTGAERKLGSLFGYPARREIIGNIAWTRYISTGCGVSRSGGLYCWGDSEPPREDIHCDGLGSGCRAPRRIPIGHPFVEDPGDDEDGDGYAAEFDVCPEVRNLQQVDTDQDGLGDLCDDDIDGDGIDNGEDNCPLNQNPDQEDTLDSGLGDACRVQRVLAPFRFDMWESEGAMCAQLANGSLWCWRAYVDSELEYVREPRWEPERAEPIDGWESTEGVGAAPCVLLADGARRCWDRSFEYPNLSLMQDNYEWRSLSLFDACGVDMEGRLICDAVWNLAGDDVEPGGVHVAPGTHWTKVVTVERFGCGIQEAGNLWCWGSNGNHMLGLGQDDPSYQAAEPQQVTERSDWQTVQAQRAHVCALNAEGEIWCWGENDAGQTGAASDRECGNGRVCTLNPSRVPGGPWKDMSVGGLGTCAVDASGTAWCWGSWNTTGEASAAPQVVDATELWERVWMVSRGICLLRGDGFLRCPAPAGNPAGFLLPGL